MCELDKIKGVDIGETYRNEKQVVDFAHYIAKTEKQKLVDQINESKYISAAEFTVEFFFADCLPTCCSEVSWEITDSSLKLEDPVTKTAFNNNEKLERKRTYDQIKRKRKFQTSWQKNRNWLVHNSEIDRMTCSVCIQYASSKNQLAPIYSISPTIMGHGNNY
jgi:hypothetical protein